MGRGTSAGDERHRAVGDGSEPASADAVDAGGAEAPGSADVDTAGGGGPPQAAVNNRTATSHPNRGGCLHSARRSPRKARPGARQGCTPEQAVDDLLVRFERSIPASTDRSPGSRAPESSSPTEVDARWRFATCTRREPRGGKAIARPGRGGVGCDKVDRSAGDRSVRERERECLGRRLASQAAQVSAVGNHASGGRRSSIGIS
jgi:hypothetical protein